MAYENEPRNEYDGFGGSNARKREPMFNLPAVVIALIAVCVAIFLLQIYVLTDSQNFWLLWNLAFIPLRYTGGYPLDIGMFVSPVSYSLLHGGVAHLIVNMIWLAAFGSPLANRIGALRFLLFWGATSVGAVALHFVLHAYEAIPLVGASGAISGMMGAAARFGFFTQRLNGKPAFHGPLLPISVVLRIRTVVTFLAVWFGINFLMGFGFGVPGSDNNIAWEAHIGGFLVGFFLMHFFDIPVQMNRRQPFNRG